VHAIQKCGECYIVEQKPYLIAFPAAIWTESIMFIISEVSNDFFKICWKPNAAPSCCHKTAECCRETSPEYRMWSQYLQKWNTSRPSNHFANIKLSEIQALQNMKLLINNAKPKLFAETLYR